MKKIDEEQIRQVLDYYEGQTEDEAVAEDEAAFTDPSQAVMIIPKELVPIVRALLARYESLKVKSPPSSGCRNRKRAATERNSVKPKTRNAGKH